MALTAHHNDTPDTPRDPLLDRVYAASAREEPPVALDDAIRAAARREVHARPRPLSARLRAWRTPVSIAAVLVLSASLVVLMREEGADTFYHAPPASVSPPQVAAEAPPAERSQQTNPSPPPSSSQGTTVAPSPALPDRKFEAQKRSDKPVQDDGSRQALEPPRSPSMNSLEERRSGALTAPAARSRPQESAEAAKEAAGGPVVAERAERDVATPGGNLSDKPLRQDSTIAKSAEPVTGSTEPTPAAEAAKAPAASPPPKPLAAQQAPSKSDQTFAERRSSAPASRAPVWTGWERQPPEKWIERIEELRRAGQETEAREMLEEFRKRFPGYPLPATLAR